MRRIAPLTVAVCLAAASCRDPLTPAAAGAPAVLKYATVGFLAEYTTVRLDGAAVVTVRTGYDDAGKRVATETRRVPSAADWQAFRAAVTEAGVARWPRECGDRGIADGGGFEFTLDLDGKATAGLHVNAFPRAGGGCATQYTDEARRFEAAVAAVAGIGAPTGP